jgi:hypothetical protein
LERLKLTNFTYNPPESAAFIYTLKKYLEVENKGYIADLLVNSNCKFVLVDGFPHREWDSCKAIVSFLVPVISISKFTDSIEGELLNTVKLFFPYETGFEIVGVEVSPIIENPPDDEQRLLNSASLVSSGSLEYDELRFRSQSEINVYQALKKCNVLFFANATAVLGSKNMKKEPDFLVCQNGKWGILEVMGDRYHTPTNAMQDHDRARLFKDYGVSCIEFYDARECYSTPEKVVKDFLKRLSKL